MKIIRVIAAGLLLWSAGSYADDDKFSSQTVGLEITKPSSWTFVTADEYKENIKRARMNDAEFQELMQKYATAPLVAMMKYPEPYDDLNPSFKINIKPLGRLKGVDGKAIIALILPQFQKLLQDYELVQEPVEKEISGLKAGYARLNYTLEIPDGRIFPTTSELWIIPRGEYYFIIGAGTRQDEKTGTRSEIAEILKSLKIDNYTVHNNI